MKQNNASDREEIGGSSPASQQCPCSGARGQASVAGEYIQWRISLANPEHLAKEERCC